MNRNGVSLIELLVVMTIIAILAAASLSMLGLTGTSARISQTETAMKQVSSLLSARRNEFDSHLAEQERKKTTELTWINVRMNAAAIASPQPLPAKMVLVTLDRYRGTFPQREEDLFGLDGVESTTADNSPLLSRWRQANPATKPNRALESSELLMLALTVGASQGAGEDVLGNISGRNVADKDGPDMNGDGIRDPNGIPEIYDGWGQPVRFYNAPTRLIRPAGLSSPVTAAADALARSLISGLPNPPATPAEARNFTIAFNQSPLNPRGAMRVMPLPPLPTPASHYFELPSPNSLEDRFHTLDTWFVPIIVSCGPDEVLGMGEPTAAGPARLGMVTDTDAAADNVSSAQRVN